MSEANLFLFYFRAFSCLCVLFVRFLLLFVKWFSLVSLGGFDLGWGFGGEDLILVVA